MGILASSVQRLSGTWWSRNEMGKDLSLYISEWLWLRLTVSQGLICCFALINFKHRFNIRFNITIRKSELQFSSRIYIKLFLEFKRTREEKKQQNGEFNTVTEKVRQRSKTTDRLIETYMWQSSNFHSLGLLEEKRSAVFKTNRANK